MTYRITAILVTLLASSISYAETAEITVPQGWSATETGIVKGNNELLLGPVLGLGDASAKEYLLKLSASASEGTELTKVGEIKNGEYVWQLTRDILRDQKKARSTFFICKKGKNKHRLLELFTDDVFALISGGKAAIGFCAQ